MTIMSANRIGALRHLRTVFEAGALAALADGALLERFLAGRGDEDSAAAFAALAERHAPMVLSVCHAAMGDRHDAEDAAQATFLILARRAGSIRRAESLASWLFGVARKVSLKSRSQRAAQAGARTTGGRDEGAGRGIRQVARDPLERLRGAGPAAGAVPDADRALPPGGAD